MKSGEAAAGKKSKVDSTVNMDKCICYRDRNHRETKWILTKKGSALAERLGIEISIRDPYANLLRNPYELMMGDFSGRDPETAYGFQEVVEFEVNLLNLDPAPASTTIILSFCHLTEHSQFRILLPQLCGLSLKISRGGSLTGTAGMITTMRTLFMTLSRCLRALSLACSRSWTSTASSVPALLSRISHWCLVTYMRTPRSGMRSNKLFLHSGGVLI